MGVKSKPCLLLASLCALLCQADLAGAQTPPPRFGYGSSPGGADAVPARSASKAAAPRPKASSAAKPKVAPKGTASAKSKAASPALAAAKPKAKSTSQSGAKSKASSTPALSKASPKRSAAGSPAASSRAVASSGSAKASALPRAARQGTSRSAEARSSRRPAAAAPLPKAAGLLADLSSSAAPAGFHFFGSPIVLPTLPPTAAPAPQLASARTGRRDPSPLPTAPPPLAPRSHKASSPALAEAPPAIEPAPLAPRSFAANPALIPAAATPVKLEEIPSALSLPVNLSLASTPADAAPLSSLLDEPTLSPATAEAPEAPEAAETAVTAEVAPDSPPSEEAARPPSPPAPAPEAAPAEEATPSIFSEATPPPAPPEPVLPANTSSDEDLSERERAFVRSLSEAVGSVTAASTPNTSSGDLPATLVTAATSLISQIPAKTVAKLTASAPAAAAKAAATLADLPLESTSDLTSPLPEKLPDHLPAFEAPATGKIDVQSDRQADYDQANHKVIFTGKVELNSAAIRLRAERVEVFMKKEGGGMERVEASGHVLMRTQDTAAGPGQMASAGRATYNLKTGEITLADWPKIQETSKSHISTDPSTKMVLFTDGRLRTDGPNRTIIGGN